MTATTLGESLARGLWTMDRFGVTPKKLAARALNRDQPRVLCVSYPKSGTHLIERALCLHPRLYRKMLPTVLSGHPDLVIAVGPGNLTARRYVKWGDLDRLLSRLRPGQVVMSHLAYRPDYSRIISARGASSLFLMRDPRDIVVSEAHYQAGHRTHRLHEVFARQATLKDRLLLSIRGDRQHGVLPIAEKLERYSGWLASGAFVMRFEDLIGSAGGGEDAIRDATLRALFDHIGLPVDDAFLSWLAGRLISTRSPTFRRGAIGSWRESFDDEVSEAFERAAGAYLQPYGYAPD